MRVRRTVGGVTLLVLAAMPLGAQNTAPVRDTTHRRDTSAVVDRVVAIVGSRPVLASQVEEEIFSRQAQGARIPDSGEARRALREQVLASIIDEELLVQQAQRDTTIKVTDEEVAEAVEQQIKKVRSKFGSETDYRSELKKSGFQTPDEYRRWLTDQQQRALFQSKLVDKLRSEKKLQPVTPTEAEMRAFFDAHNTNLGKRPATLSFRQIVISPKPSAEAKERARVRADSIVTELRKGADFAAAARRLSDDHGSRELGGDLGWFRRGVMVPEFERVAFDPRLKPGMISNPVETPFGFHIIQVERAQPTEVQARHILIVPEIDSARVDSARALADSVARLMRAGASFDSLQRIYHDRSAERGGNNIPVTSLPEQYAKAIGNADSGTVVPVLSLPGTGERPQFFVLQVLGRRPEGEVGYEDVKDRIRSDLSQQLGIRRYLDRLRRSTYVEVRS